MIELIMVIAIIGILAVTALPKFFQTTSAADQAAVNGVAGALRSGLMLYRVNNLASGGSGNYPESLDNVPAFTTCDSGNQCFNYVLDPAITDNHWFKESDNRYGYTGTGANYTLYYDSYHGSIYVQNVP